MQSTYIQTNQFWYSIVKSSSANVCQSWENWVWKFWFVLFFFFLSHAYHTSYMVYTNDLHIKWLLYYWRWAIFGLGLHVSYDWQATAQIYIMVSFQYTTLCTISSISQKLWPPEVWCIQYMSVLESVSESGCDKGTNLFFFFKPLSMQIERLFYY